MEMNHNVTISFNGNTKTVEANRALEQFIKMKEHLLNTRSNSSTTEYQKIYIDKKLQGIDNIISGIQDGYKLVYEDNRHRIYDKPMYNKTNLSKKKQYTVVCDKEDKIADARFNLTELDSFDNYDEAFEFASKMAIKNYAINKKYGTVVAIIDNNTNQANIIRAEQQTSEKTYENCREQVNLSKEQVSKPNLVKQGITKLVGLAKNNNTGHKSVFEMTEKEYWEYQKQNGYMFWASGNPDLVKAAREKEENLFIYGNIIVTDDMRNIYHVINFDNSRDAFIHAAGMLSLQLGMISEGDLSHPVWLRERLGIKDSDLLECKESLLKYGYYKLNSLYIVDLDRYR